MFGECPTCGGPLERPFWDAICFGCFDELVDELDDVEVPDEDFYIAPHEGRG